VKIKIGGIKNRFASSCDLAYICDMAVYTIYCLTDSVTNLPFYVGATKHPLYIRLIGHKNDFGCNRRDKNSPFQLRANKYRELIAIGATVNITPLFVVAAPNVDFCEKWFYWHFRFQGHILLQHEHGFYYQKQKLNGKDNEH
jgi:hypothetical protein